MRFAPSYWPLDKQQRLKAPPGATGTEIISPEFFNQLLLAMHDLLAALDLRFGWEAPTAFAGPLESRADLLLVGFA